MGNYLTFASGEAFTIGVNNATKNWNGKLYYSTDTASWTEWDGATAIESALHNGEQRIYMRGSGNYIISGDPNKRWTMVGNGIHCSGNIETLLDFETVEMGKHPPMGAYCFAAMFLLCPITSAPELPSTTLAQYCYQRLFYGCSNLTTAPELPATALENGCYEYMFSRCANLTTAPELPATTLAQYCYSSMFSHTGLTTVPKLPATTLADSCYENMFYSCTNLTTAPELPATTLADSCYYSMFEGCESIKLSETQTDEYKTPYTIPSSGIGTTATDAVNYMFNTTGGTFTGTPSINTTYYGAWTVEKEDETERFSFIGFLASPKYPGLPKNIWGWKMAQKRGDS